MRRFSLIDGAEWQATGTIILGRLESFESWGPTLGGIDVLQSPARWEAGDSAVVRLRSRTGGSAIALVDCADISVWQIEGLCEEIGAGFHPDTPAEEYILADGSRFSPECVHRVNTVLARAFDALGDQVYPIGLKKLQALNPSLFRS